MKKQVTIMQAHCDQCNAATYTTKCLLCGKEFCYECSKTYAVKYQHAVHFSGGGDGLYCVGCDAKLLKEGKDKLHGAFVLISRLRFEEAAWYEDFKSRMNAAEEALKRLPRGEHDS